MVDIELFVEVEMDFWMYGDEVVFGGGKMFCDGLGMVFDVI